MYDIGMVYKKKGKYYLCVGSKQLLSFAKGRPMICRVRKKGLKKVYGMSVGELCQAWKINIDTLDRVVEKYLLHQSNSEGSSSKKKKKLAHSK